MTNIQEPSMPRDTDDTARFWDGWNRTWRFRDDLDGFMSRQRDVAVELAARIGVVNGRILDAGCGTGWLGNALLRFGDVWATDVSPEAIAEGKRRHPQINFVLGNFLKADLPGGFDFAVSADSFAHMPDDRLSMARFAELLKPGGTFLLMTQNPSVWRWRSTLDRTPCPVNHANPNQWPSLNRIKTLMRDSFTIVSVSSIEPGGDRGPLWWVENRYVRGLARRLVGQGRWRTMLETARLGREYVIVARRN